MGNPNARPKTGGLRRTNSQLSNYTYGSAVSPKTPTKRGNFGTASMDSNSSMGINHGASLRKDSVEDGFAKLTIEEESPTKPALKFKSYKTGTLMTNNGVPADAFIAAFPPPLPSPKVSQLRATTPAFVPRAFQPPVAPSAHAFPNSNANTLAYQRVQDLLQDMRTPVIAGPSNSQNYNPFYNTAPTGPSSLLPTSQYHQYGAVQAPRIFYERRDKSKKDIIITTDGVIRNAVKVVRSFHPNQSPYHDYVSEYEGNYDFVAEFNKMSAKDQAALMAHKQVEIVVKMTTYDEDEKVEFVVVKKRRQKKGSKGKGQAAPFDGNVDVGNGGFSAGVDVSTSGFNATEGGYAMVDTKGKGKEVVVTNQVGTDGGVMAATTVIDIINALGPAFALNTKSLYVTLDFTTIPQVKEPPIPTGPRGNPGLLPPPGPAAFGENFQFITSLVRTLNSFTALQNMVVNLRVHSAHNTRPITMPQLTLVLPFYDLGFTGWKVSHQMEFMTTSVPVGDFEYPVKWLDLERNKILLQREKKINNTTFVRRSGVEGKVATWNKQK